MIQQDLLERGCAREANRSGGRQDHEHARPFGGRVEVLPHDAEALARQVYERGLARGCSPWLVQEIRQPAEYRCGQQTRPDEHATPERPRLVRSPTHPLIDWDDLTSQ